LSTYDVIRYQGKLKAVVRVEKRREAIKSVFKKWKTHGL
jgi:hypothetical protein